jgi:hypothetical protein
MLQVRGLFAGQLLGDWIALIGENDSADANSNAFALPQTRQRNWQSVWIGATIVQMRTELCLFVSDGSRSHFSS